METASAFAVRDSVRQAVLEIKVSLLGDSAVGKTSISAAFVKEALGDFVPKSTICIELATKFLVYPNGDRVRFTIYDTAGQEKYKSIMPNQVHNMDAIVVVYDITSRESFVHLDRWLHYVHSHTPYDVPVIIVGNKTDLSDKREVSLEEGLQKAQNCNSMFMETSAKTGYRVPYVFQQLSTAIRDKKMHELFNGVRMPLSSMAVSLHQQTPDENRPCCSS